MKNFVALMRVSTRGQGESRNGLEAQRAEIERWAAYNQYNIVAYLDEVASGSLELNERPVLQAALSLAKKMKAKVVVSKTDRATRNSSLAAELFQKKKCVVTVDLGEKPDEFVQHIFSGLASKERKMISERTKAGLAAAKARGVVLGNQTNFDVAQERGRIAQRVKAVMFAEKHKATINALRKEGNSYAEIAQILNSGDTPTARGGEWHATSVMRILQR